MMSVEARYCGLHGFCLREYCFGSSAEAQSGGMIVAHSLLDDLQSSLEERFSVFVEAQAAGHWGELADLLGRFRLGCDRGNLYTNSYNECLVSRI